MDIISISSANGWRAVYKNRGDGNVFSVPLVSWALVKDWNEHDWLQEIGCTAIIGMVLSPSNHSIVPAAEVEHVEDEAHSHENPALFCGYIAPEDELSQSEWEPVWNE